MEVELLRNKMIKTILLIALLTAFVVSTVVFWVPSIFPKYTVAMVSISKEFRENKSLNNNKALEWSWPSKEIFSKAIPAPTPAPTSTYNKVKQEVKEWTDILAKFIPIVSLILAWHVKRKM